MNQLLQDVRTLVTNIPEEKQSEETLDASNRLLAFIEAHDDDGRFDVLSFRTRVMGWNGPADRTDWP